MEQLRRNWLISKHLFTQKQYGLRLEGNSFQLRMHTSLKGIFIEEIHMTVYELSMDKTPIRMASLCFSFKNIGKP